MIYRDATVFDALPITDLWWSMYREVIPEAMREAADGKERERFMVTLIARLYETNFYCFVAEDKGQLVGMIYGKCTYEEFTNKLGVSCDALYVLPEYRKRNMASNLIKKAYAWGKQNRTQHYDISTVYDLRLAMDWQRRGFEPYKIIYRKAVRR